MFFDKKGEVHEELSSLGSWAVFSVNGVESLLGGIDGDINISSTCLSYLGDFLASGRVNDRLRRKLSMKIDDDSSVKRNEVIGDETELIARSKSFPREDRDCSYDQEDKHESKDEELEEGKKSGEEGIRNGSLAHE